MAVSLMKKINIFAHISLQEKIVNTLQELGLIQIIDINPVVSSISECNEIKSLKDNLKQIEKAIEFIDTFEKNQIKEKPILEEKEFEKIGKEYDYASIKQTIDNLTEKFDLLEKKESSFNAIYKSLLPWEKLPYSLDLLEKSKTNNTQFFLGKFSIQNKNKVIEEIKNITFNYIFEIVSENKEEIFFFCLVIKKHFENFINIFKKYGFTQIILSVQKNTVAQNLQKLENNFIEIKTEKEKIIKEIQSLGFDKIKLMAKSDYISQIIKQKEIKYLFSKTSQSILISGWIKKNNIDTIIKRLSQFKEIEIIFLSPSPEEEPPVDLNNKTLLKPFEIITNLYGIPHYTEIDPTPFLAPFFALFFALCMTDAGYGLIILLACIFLLKKFQDKGAKHFLHLFIILSTSTIIVGILTGGFFGIDFTKLPSQLKFLQNIRTSVMLFDPIENAMVFFILAIGLGIIHILLGFFIKIIWKFKNKIIMDPLLDEMPWVMIMLSCIFLVLISVFCPHLILAKNICFISFIVSCLIIVVFGGRPRKGFKRILVGFYKLYGIMGIVGDILSYTRLLALGLVSCVLASVINIVSSVFWNYGISFFKNGGIKGILLFLFCAIFSILIIIGGHLFIVLISILGSFIHTMRLQFVEFFTKFYEGGGNLFSPFKKEEKHIRFKN